jgi:hypothetical protein
MKQIRRITTRSVLVPLALLALVMATSIPANAASLPTDASPTVVSVRFGPLSINW